MKTTFKNLIMLSTLAAAVLGTHKGMERLAMPLAEGESRTYQIVYALGSRDFGEDATITLDGERLTISQGDCSFGGNIVGQYDKFEFAFEQGTFSRSSSLCTDRLGDVQTMISDLYDIKEGYVMRSKVFYSEWLVIGWNSATEGKVDLLIGQKVIPNEHSLNPESS